LGERRLKELISTKGHKKKKKRKRIDTIEPLADGKGKTQSDSGISQREKGKIWEGTPIPKKV